VAIEKDLVIEFVNSRGRPGHCRLLHNAACYLIRLILEEHEFADMEELVAFCAAPDNLRMWLPSETDRIIFSEGLVEELRELTACFAREAARTVKNENREKNKTAHACIA
jgi:hypothetical protein